MTDKKILDADQKKNSDEILKDEELEKVSGGTNGVVVGTSVVAGGSSYYSPSSNNSIEWNKFHGK